MCWLLVTGIDKAGRRLSGKPQRTLVLGAELSEKQSWELYLHMESENCLGLVEESWLAKKLSCRNQV